MSVKKLDKIFESEEIESEYAYGLSYSNRTCYFYLCTLEGEITKPYCYKRSVFPFFFGTGTGKDIVLKSEQTRTLFRFLTI